MYLDWWITLWHDNPVHLLVETTLIVLILYILIKRPTPKKTKVETLPSSVVQELIDEFEPEPLCPPMDKGAEMILEDRIVLEGKAKKYTKVRGVEEPVLNMVTFDFLGIGQRDEIKQAATKALDKYGCGSCGPRGFYGSIDVHVYLEQHLAKYFGTEEAIVYSDAASTLSSSIPAFSNRADLLVVDDGCNDPIMTGVNLSRSRVLFFKHNDMKDLESILEKIDEEDKRLNRKPQRRFIIVEGLYRNYGDIAPLPELMELKEKYKWRIYVDESHSIGVFGKGGRGVHEHFGIPSKDIDLLISALSTTLSSVGGFCVGSREVVEHQRLSGSGYCFSASSPPFVSTCASAGIEIMTNEADKMIPKLQKNAKFFNAKVNDCSDGRLVTTSNPESALVHIRLGSEYRHADGRNSYTEETRCAEESVLREIVREVKKKGYLLCVSNYIVAASSRKAVGKNPPQALPPPSIRAVVTTLQTEDELESVAKALAEIAKRVVVKPEPKPAGETVKYNSHFKKRR